MHEKEVVVELVPYASKAPAIPNDLAHDAQEHGKGEVKPAPRDGIPDSIVGGAHSKQDREGGICMEIELVPVETCLAERVLWMYHAIGCEQVHGFRVDVDVWGAALGGQPREGKPTGQESPRKGNVHDLGSCMYRWTRSAKC